MGSILTATIKPIYLFADSQLLFWEADGSRFLASVRTQVEASSPTAAYLGASNGDNPDFYSIFTSAMEGVGIQNCRLIRAGFPAEDKKFLERADLILLAGGDIKRGWEVFEKNGMKQSILQRYSEGAVLLGISAGAVQLGLLGWHGDSVASNDELFDTFKLVPFVIGVHEEKDGWKNLGRILRLKDGPTKGLGIPFGGGLIYHPNQTLESIRMPVVLVSMQDRKVTESLLFPSVTKVG
jgi:peptidase E